MKSAEEIIEKLKSSFNTPSRKDEKLKVVVICIVISTTFWFFSALNKSDYTTQLDYPIEFEFEEETFIPVSDLPKKLRIEVTGGGWDLMTSSFGFGMEPIRINLEDPTSSKYQLASTLRGDLSAKMTKMNLNFILTDTLFYNIQRRIRRQIPLAFDSLSIILDAGHRITSEISLTPTSIELEGPEDLVNEFPNPFIVYPGSNSLGADVDDQFDLPPLGSALIEADISRVRASFEVTEFMEFDEVLEVAVINNANGFIRLDQPRIRAFFTKSEKDLNRTSDTLEIALFADALKINKKDSTVQVQVGVQAPYIRDLRLEATRLKVKYE